MIFLGLGSNLPSKKYGNPIDNCLKVIEVLKKYFLIKKTSSFYQSEPIPKSNQPWYINSVLSVETKLSSFQVMDLLLKIESSFGRIRKKKNEPRVIDLDLLIYNDEIINTKNLTLPHPRLHERNFVLFPIKEIEPNWIHPVFQIKPKDLIKLIKENQKLTILKKS